MLRLSRRAGNLGESVTLAIDAKAKALTAQGKRVLGFGVGQPDFDTPEPIKEAARKSLDGRIGGYTPVAGTPALREAVAASFRAAGIENAAAGNVLTSCGAKHSLYNAVSVLVDDGDEVIVPAPYWVSYPSMVEAAGGTTVVVDTCPDACILTPERLAAAMTDKTKLLIFNSPGNPSGVTHSREQIHALAPVLAARPDVAVLSDEIYQHLVYGDTEFSAFAAACPELTDRIVTVNGISKSYAMTGWRIGYATGPKDVIGAMTRFQSHTTSNATAIAQVAAVAALTGSQDAVEEMRLAFDRRRLLMSKLLVEIPGFELVPPTGAFYCFPDIAGAINDKTGSTPLEFTNRLLDEHLVACVPGEAFGAPTSIRLSYACSDDDIREGCERIAKFVAT